MSGEYNPGEGGHRAQRDDVTARVTLKPLTTGDGTPESRDMVPVTREVTYTATPAEVEVDDYAPVEESSTLPALRQPTSPAVPEANQPSRAKELQEHPYSPGSGITNKIYTLLNKEDGRYPGYYKFDETLKQRKARLLDRLVYCMSLGYRPVIDMSAIKSAGKTTLGLGIGNALSEDTNKLSVILPFTNDTTGSTLKELAGRSNNYKKPITVGEFLTLEDDRINSGNKLESILAETPTGLRFIIQDEDAMPIELKEKTKRYVQAVDRVLPNVTGAVILDEGNNETTMWGTQRAAIHMAHVAIHPFMADKPTTRNKLATTTRNLASQPLTSEEDAYFFSNFVNKRESGIPLDGDVRSSVLDKLNSSIIVANNASRGIDFSSVAKQGWHGTGLYVPNEGSYDKVDADGETMPCDWEMISRANKVAYLAIAVAMYEIAGWRVGAGEDLGQPMVANIPELADAPINFKRR